MKSFILFYKSISQVGGAEILLSNHYLWLKKRNFNVKVICFDYKSLDRIDIQKEDLIQIKGQNIFIKFLKFRLLVNKLKYKHIYCHSGYIDTFISLLFKEIKYSIFYHHPTSMTVNELDKFSLFFWRKFKKLQKKDLMFPLLEKKFKNFKFIEHIFINLRLIISYLALNKAHKIFVLTDKAKNEMKKIFNLDAVVAAGALSEHDLYNFNNYKIKNISKSSINLLAISRHDPNKRIDIIIKSIPFLIKEGITPKLVIGGVGEDTNYLKSLVKQLNLKSYVTFSGYINVLDIKKYYEKTDIFISIDWGDFRLTTFEALTYKLRVIVSEETSYTKLFSSGFLFSSKAKEKALAENIIRCINCKKLWNEDKLLSHLKNYTWDKYFLKILNHC